jgi:GNAT superfamily N-acetyltransferase
LNRQATQDVRKRVAVAFVLTPDGRIIAGYYTLSQYSVQLDAMPDEIARRFPKYPYVPATLIGRLARSVAFQGQGVGELLLLDAIERCLDLSKQIASAGIIVDAKDDAAERFYLRYGFVAFPKVAGRLFLPMGTVEELFGHLGQKRGDVK